MRKWICALMAVCMIWHLCALAESELPVLTAQLGKAAEMVEQTEMDDEYTEVLNVDGITVIMGRYAGELSAEGLGLKFSDDLHDGDLLIEGEGGIDERAMFYIGGSGAGDVMDVSVIWLDGYTYGFACVADEAAYFGDVGDEPLRNQIDFWVSTLDVFDGEFSTDSMNDISMMLLYESPLYDEAELIDSGSIGDGGYYMEFMAEAGLVRIGEYTLPVPDDAEDTEAVLADAAQVIHPDAREFFVVRNDDMSMETEYPRYVCGWVTGQNEDTREVRAVMITGEQTLVLMTSVAIDWAEDYVQQIDELLASVTLYVGGIEAEGPYMAAEEIAYALLGEYMDYWYAWNETIGAEEYWVYEFADMDGECIGAVAVQEETGAAYISIGTDAMEAQYEPVLWDDAQGYYLPDSVG